VALLGNSTGRFFAVDIFTWSIDKNYLKNPGLSGSYEFKNDLMTVGDVFDDNTKEYSNRIIKIVGRSPPTYKWDGPLADIIFIDGDHSYEGCQADILFWKQFVKPNGYLIGHDYTEGWPGVRQAVEDSGKFEVFKETSIWSLFL
jgi:hypothetical protein